MIPYEDLTFKDFNFYWGSSTMFTKYEGMWLGVKVHCTDGYGDLLYDRMVTLEELDSRGEKLRFTTHPFSDRQVTIEVSPLTLFKSNDWMTYEPELGYFYLQGRLTLLTSSSPRNRHKALHSIRLKVMPVIDNTAVSGAMRRRLNSPHPSNRVSMEALIPCIEERLNTAFPDSWYTAVNKLLKEGTEPIIVDPAIAVLPPDSARGCGHILFKGTLMGTITLKDSSDKIEFTPRAYPTSTVERKVNEWIKTKLSKVA